MCLKTPFTQCCSNLHDINQVQTSITKSAYATINKLSRLLNLSSWSTNCNPILWIGRAWVKASFSSRWYHHLSFEGHYMYHQYLLGLLMLSQHPPIMKYSHSSWKQFFFTCLSGVDSSKVTSLLQIIFFESWHQRRYPFIHILSSVNNAFLASGSNLDYFTWIKQWNQICERNHNHLPLF